MGALGRGIVLLATVTGVGACASRQTPSVTQAGAVRWTGSFKQTRVPTAEMGPATPNRGFGSITVTPQQGTPPSARVDITINAAVTGGTQVAWAILDGACGSAAPLVTGENQFQPIEIAVGGNGTLRTTMSLALDPRASYHANIYWTARARDISTVMMCAPLGIDRR